jgi:hypothetical protein
MTEKRSRGQPKFEPTQDQRNQVKLMKAPFRVYFPVGSPFGAEADAAPSLSLTML